MDNKEIELLVDRMTNIDADYHIEELSEYGQLYQFGDSSYDAPEWEFGCEVDFEDLIDQQRALERAERSNALFKLNMGLK